MAGAYTPAATVTVHVTVVVVADSDATEPLVVGKTVKGPTGLPGVPSPT